jgi:hypothetical protein
LNEGSIMRPLDKFARDFLLYLSDLFYVEESIELGRIPVPKVLLCNDQCWKQLYPVVGKAVRGSPSEYADAVTVEEWPRVNAQLLMAVEMEKETGAIQLAGRKVKEDSLRHSGFPLRIVGGVVCM